MSDERDRCVFCRIVDGKLPSTVVHRDRGFVAIEDAQPKADVHLLVVPERHVETLREIGSFDAEETKRMLEFVTEAARAAGLGDYRVIVNVGPGGGQTVFHLHWHVLGGSLPAFG